MVLIPLVVSLAMVGAEDQSALEQWVLAALSTNEAKYSRGALRATSSSDALKLKTDVELSLIWEGSSTYTDYTVRERILRDETTPPRWKEFAIRRVKQVESGGVLWSYDATAGVLTEIRDSKRRALMEIGLRPEQCWFRSINGRKWTELFDRTIFSPDNFGIVLTRRADGHIVVDREHLPSSATSELVFAPELGGNLISCRTKQPEKSDAIDFNWAQNPDGAWYVKSFNSKRSDEKGDLLFEFHFDVHEFDSNPTIPEAQFSPESLKMASGTFVTEISNRGRRSYRQGEPPKTDANQFEDLIKHVRARGFLSRERAPQ